MLLAIDTSTQKVGLALYDGAQVLHEATWPSAYHHTVELAPAIEKALAGADITAADLEVICVANGPGSFTGLRIGLALAKGLAMACNIPLVSVPTLDIVAAAQPVQEMQLAAVLEAGRTRLAVGWYKPKDDTWVMSKSEVLTPKDFSKRIRKPTVICGELTAELRKLLGRKRKNALLVSPAKSIRRPGVLAEIGWSRWQVGETDDPATLAPSYLHSGDPIPA